ncbi:MULTISPECIES: hypothetical protein [unclassified Mesorhizobium]|uniref:hypothetical protein n=1 Tax=unclassified Mesorhizobium TaxID=325217 RepID=UPI000BAEC58A|nr:MULTISPECIES: hypothetical protein [unclassified Mesorhizobium]TGT58571.1 hypothetical protein EN813_031440 [Mesorhizobium sp. M00.F.Ca.ET.170.01.1.1]AZO12036.1 hypothetical protein EJ074_25195 [Mesorhizobium sp. M3A.F.Ca.ET.080.04.2.1]PBB84325.1 hypothetical protein CK216_23375 [Mesorhizobium sp. WSM3876]RWB74752.1 MAG: hypothetical protein EOQ49_05050 [Mesorhizobium sp.]RWB89789.1 MAG: hypothetical protein EOQ52_11835 [Mesorhizobium sp.]
MIGAGVIGVNSFGKGEMTTPFGGPKQLGFGSLSNSLQARDQYTQLKTIWSDLTMSGPERF